VSETRLAIPLIGRQRHVETIRGWVADLGAGQGRAALIEGEPGIGKSSLVRAVAAHARDAGCLVLWASCDELSQAFPLLPLLDALNVRAPSAGCDPTRIVEMLRADVTRANGVDVVPAAVERLLTLVDELCAVAPVLLVVDDLHWADPATVMALGRLARSVRQHPMLVIGTSRPLPRREDLLALRRLVEPAALLRVHSLTEAEAAQLVGQAVGGTPGPRLLRLARGAAGNPLYLTELVDALIRGRTLVANDGVVETTGGRPPESLTAAIADRLEFLSPPVRDVLRTAALLGMDFSVSELAVLSGQRVGDLLSVLDDAILAGVLLENGVELAFRHPLIRAALYDSMPAALRAAWHRDAAKALAEMGAPVERVARQLLPAAEAQEVTGAANEWMTRWLTDAGQQLVGQAPHVAIPLLRWAISGVPAGVAPHDVLACRLADALSRVGNPADAMQVATGALAHVTRPDLIVDLQWTLTRCRIGAGQSQEALNDLLRTLELPDLKPGDRARIRVLVARTYRSLGRVELAGKVAKTALAEATETGDRWATGWALSILTVVHGMRGEAAEALPLFDRALAVSEGDPALADLRLLLQINQAVALGDLDRCDAAISAAEQVRQRADDAGNAVRLAQAQGVLGELLYEVGRWDDALSEFQLGSGPSTNPSVECSAHGMAAVIQFHRGEAAAHQHLEDAERSATMLGDRVLAPLVLARSLEREHADAPEEALAVLMKGMPDSAEEAGETRELFADAVRLAVAVGDREAARSIVRRAEAVARTSDGPYRRAVRAHCRGLLDGDAAMLVKAAGEYAAAGRPLPRAQALEAAAMALANAGDTNGARGPYTEAFALYTELGARWDLARTQATFRTYGIRRGPHTPHRRSDRGWGSLTPTEMKVVELVARGMSNPSIAAELFLSRRTVQTHVSHVLAKLDLHSRTDIAREASMRDLAGRDGERLPAGDALAVHRAAR
jgi:ATP/maltotriose-dependent transcriptional regulator MalT